METDHAAQAAIGVLAITVLAMPAALFALAIVAMWPNSTFEELLFQKVDGQMITPKDVLHRLNAEGYGQHAASFADVWTEAQFEARLVDITRRHKPGLKTRDDGHGRSPAVLDWRYERKPR